jgi:glyceraldehyde 3-phosphate dehydrogenase
MAAVAINGLGRIGRAALKVILDTPGLDLAAVNDLVPPENLAYLLKFDSVYGRYDRDVGHGEANLVIDGTPCRVLGEKDPSRLPWGDLGVDLVFECTGRFTGEEDLRAHLDAGAKKVILSAPAKGGNVPTVVYGVNEPEGDPDIVSCASCTTNCIAPVVEIVGRRIGVKKASLTTIHAYTATQKIVDGPARKMRRGRAGAINLVPTTTGAAKATTLALPQLAGKFDGIAVRGPVPVGSLADVTFLTQRKTSVDEVNGIFREEADGDRYRGVLGASDEERVSTDIIRDPRASVVDLGMTQVVDGDMLKVLSWYDNEWGYVNQMIRQALRMLS